MERNQVVNVIIFERRVTMITIGQISSSPPSKDSIQPVTRMQHQKHILRQA